MRCEEVIRELAVPTAGRDELAISQHLAGCEACARWADQAVEFDRLWDVTRPVEPSAEAWDNLWSAVGARLDQAAPRIVNGTRSSHSPVLPSAVAPPPSGRGRYWRGLAAVGVIGLAQAAALLVAVGIAWRTPVTEPSVPPTTGTPTLARNSEPGLDSVVEVEEGEVVLIHSDGKKIRVDELTARDTSNGVDEYYPFFNVVEAMAKSIVAMTE